MAKSYFFGLKKGLKLVLGSQKNFNQIGQKLPKYGQKLFSSPKVQKVAEKFFVGKIGQKMTKMVNVCFLGLKRVQNVILGPENKSVQIGQKIS